MTGGEASPARGERVRRAAVGRFTPPSTRQLALISAILASAIANVDATAVNVALPAISRDLGGGLAAQQWVSNAYLLTLSALILLAGSLTDRLGERRVFVAGVAGFGIGSALCAAAPTVGLLIVARALQGVAGAMLVPAALAIIVAVFDESERGGAIGTWTAWGGLGFLLGPIVGGQIVDVASWRWIFVINVPLLAIALLLAARSVPGRSERADRSARVDWLGAALAAAALSGISFGLIEQPVLGWSAPGVWGSIAGGIVLLIVFLLQEDRVRVPMLPLVLFARRNFSVTNAQTMAMYGAIGILAFFQTIYLQQVAGYSALKAGATGLVPTIVMFLFSRRVGRLADRIGSRPFLIAGPLLAACGFLLMLRYGTHVSFVADALPAMIVFSFGLALTVSPLTATVLADASDADAGIASAVNNAIARTASLIAVAAIGAVAAAQYGAGLQSRLATRLPASAAPALTEAKRHTFRPIDPAKVPAADRPLVATAGADASRDAFHVAMGIGAGLLFVAGLGGLALRGRCPPHFAAVDCAGGQIVGAPVAAGEHPVTAEYAA